MKRYRLPVHTDIGNTPAGRHDLLAKLEGCRNTDRLDDRVDATHLRHAHHRSFCFPVGAVDNVRSPKTFGNVESLVVDIDHDDLSWRIECGGKERSKPNRP